MGTRQRLSDEAVEAFLAAHPGWAVRPAGGPGQVGVHPQTPGGAGALTRTYSFDDYAAGVAFAVQVAFAAEARDHHPDLHIGWRRVQVAWSTHDAGGITPLDTEMAERTDQLAR
jgi:4a-hydroxytetrahydrobiopterin dehydratase